MLDVDDFPEGVGFSSVFFIATFLLNWAGWIGVASVENLENSFFELEF